MNDNKAEIFVNFSADLVNGKTSYALIEKEGRITLYKGAVHELADTQDIHALARRENKDVVFVLPYRTIRERGFEAQGEEPILALLVDEQAEPIAVEEFCALIPDHPVSLEGPIKACVEDERQAEMIAAFQKKEIEGGNASQVNLSRIFRGKLSSADNAVLLSVYKRLLRRTGQYMTVLFCNHKEGQYIVGATPECHLEVSGEQTVMMPIAGTLRKEDHETFEQRLQSFLIDSKEINELYQVTDEELKMMARICPDGGKIEGPYLKEIGNVVHTYYKLIGNRSENSIESLRHTLHAPTVVGSPMESAARIICQYEPESRRYYAGEIGVYDYKGRDDSREYGDLDVAILIRCAEVEADGNFRIQAGGGIVRDSDPYSEIKEDRAKASVMVDAFTAGGAQGQIYLTPELHDKYHPTLMQRNRHLSHFWMNKQTEGRKKIGARVTLINNEDDFCLMLAHVFKSIGCRTVVKDTFDYDMAGDESDIVVIGPGPGDINDGENPRMVALRRILGELRAREKPLLGVCLGHQALAALEGIPVVQQKQSSQGMPRIARVLGQDYRLGFYNSFSAVYTRDLEDKPHIKTDLDDEGRIVAMTGPRFIGFQFHPESIMSEQGNEVLREALARLLGNGAQEGAA
ncbi:MAG: chorismate-binding protein [Micavibrio sp.]